MELSELSKQSRDLAIAEAEDLAGALLIPAFAKLYSQHTRLRSGQEGLSGWRANESRDRLTDAVRLIDAAFVLREVGKLSWKAALVRAAELLEWLSHPSINADGAPTRALAAAAYQLAGYPARASGLWRGAELEGASALLMDMLTPDLQRLTHELLQLWSGKTPDSISGNSKQDKTLDETLVDGIESVCGLLVSSMRWGQESRLDDAFKKMDAIARLLLHGSDRYSWLLIKLFSEVVRVYWNESMRKNLSELKASLREEGRVALERYLRVNFLDGKVLFWPSQISGVERLITNESFALCTPTGSGKTTVAEIALLQSLFSQSTETSQSSLAIYFVPSRALATEVEAKFSRILRRVGQPVRVTGLYGGADWGPTDAWLTANEPTLLICTYEKGDALIKFLGPLFLANVRLVVIDEAHMVRFDGNIENLRAHDSRALRLESLITRLFSQLKPGAFRTIALSAVAAGFEDELAKWITGSASATAIATPYRSTRQLVGRLLCSPGGRFQIYFDLLDGSSLEFQDVNAPARPFIPDPFPPHPPVERADFKGIEKMLRPHLLWAALNLAAPDESGTRRSVLISVAQGIGGIAQDFITLLKQWEDKKLPGFFESPSDEAGLLLWGQCLSSCKDYFGVDSREYQLLALGIVVHHGKMPGLLARRLVEVIERRIARVVVATSTLSEGVNLPFETILLPTIRRAGSTLSVSEFANLVGRAGRPGVSTEGTTLVLQHSNYTPTDSKEAWALESAVNNYRGLVEGLRESGAAASANVASASPLSALLLDIYTNWLEISNTDSIEEFLNWLEQTVPQQDDTASEIEGLDALDGILMSMVVDLLDRPGIYDETVAETRLTETWHNTFAYYADSQTDWLSKAFISRSLSIRSDIYPDEGLRKRIYATGLPPRRARGLIDAYKDIFELLQSGAGYHAWSPDQRLAFVAKVVGLVGDVKAFRLPLKSGNSNVKWQDALHWWLSPSTASLFPKPPQVSAWQDYVNSNFVYKFSWALGSVLSISFDDANVSLDVSLENWPKTGLPWIAFWLKELMTWGTLDPVAAFLLAHGQANTRAEAESKAAGYYSQQSLIAENEDADPLDPRAIRIWSEGAIPAVASVKAATLGYSATLLRDFGGRTESYRVLPALADGRIYWFDPGGFPLAFSELEGGEAPEDHIELTTDFALLPGQQSVISQGYLEVSASPA